MKWTLASLVLICFASQAAAQLNPEQQLRLGSLIKSLEIVSSRLRIGGDGPIRLGSTVTGGMEVTAAVLLNNPAGANGVTVTVSSNNEAIAKPPASVRVSAGTPNERFYFLTTPVTSPTNVTITASTNRPGDSKSATFTVMPTAMADLTLDASSVIGGTPVTAHVKFSGPPPTSPAVQAKLASSDPNVAHVPSLVTLAQQHTVTDFTIQTSGVSQTKTVQITATYGNREETGSLTVQEAALKQIGNTCANGTVCSFGFGAPPPVTLPVFLTGAAPTGGITVNLSSSDTQKFPVPSTVTIPTGQDHASISINFGMATTGSATITAGYKGVTKSVSFSLVPPDLSITSMTFVDRNNNTITKATDSQPFNVCVKLYKFPEMGTNAITLRLAYVKHTGGTASTGREFELTPTFAHNGNTLEANVCTQLPGIEPGQWLDVTATADSKNVLAESNENNNTAYAKIEH